VTGRRFPSEAYSPYRIAPEQAAQLLRELEREGLHAAAEEVHAAAVGASDQPQGQ
jgi:hypothetical protein